MDGLLSASRGRFVFVLIKQTPNKPAWAIQPGESIRWQAAMMTDRAGRSLLLAFTSLPKAVEFMQTAVMTGTLKDIHRVAKFDKTAAREWGTDLMLNPPFELLRN